MRLTNKMAVKTKK